MATNYVPKNPVLGPTRIQRVAKKIIDESADDRKLALETHRFFRQMVDENTQDAAAKSLMVDCLKVAQASKNNVIKVLNLVIKMEEIQPDINSKSGTKNVNSVFSELDSIIND